MEARKYLIDTNIFLEILLNQQKRNICSDYLANVQHESVHSHFSLHSIGVVCSKRKLYNVFNHFISDILPVLEIISIIPKDLPLVSEKAKGTGLDFDDAYQLIAAQIHQLGIVTLDSDFKKLENKFTIHLL